MSSAADFLFCLIGFLSFVGFIYATFFCGYFLGRHTDVDLIKHVRFEDSNDHIL